MFMTCGKSHTWRQSAGVSGGPVRMHNIKYSGFSALCRPISRSADTQTPIFFIAVVATPAGHVELPAGSSLLRLFQTDFLSLYFNSDEDEKVQKNTFTRWINYHLEEHSSSGRVVELFEDFRDGVLLCHLIEVLTGEALAVHKGRVSKRVHHIANLTTALTVLRRRGLELINNNAADIADGNPRIILGLVWQIILHFQIETNLLLLREWGWTTSATLQTPSTSEDPKTPSQVSSGSGSVGSLGKSSSSPLRSRIASFLTPTKRSTPKPPLHTVKSSVEQVFLHWINSEISGLVHGQKIDNMDKQWRDGVLFCALVARWRPDLIDMEKVFESNPKDNLELAFSTAEKHLHIRRLLEVEEVMTEKPDRRSVITYVSQFIRMFGERSPMQGREQHVHFLEWLESTHVQNFRELSFQACSRIRREFIEHRTLFNTIMATKMDYTLEELVEMEKKWDQIREELQKHQKREERELPEPFEGISSWIAQGEKLLAIPLQFESVSTRDVVISLQKMIAELTKYIRDLPMKKEELEEASVRGGLGGRRVAPEFSEPLRTRMADLEEEHEPRLGSLKVLLSYYLLLAYLQDIEEKIVLWRTADSLTLLLRWTKEYAQLLAENPRAHCAQYINNLRDALATPHDEPRKTLKKTLTSLTELRQELHLLKAEWSDWELQISQLEETIEQHFLHGTVITNDEHAALTAVEASSDQLSPKLSAAARLANNQRLEVLRGQIRRLDKRKLGGRLVVELQPTTSAQITVTGSREAADEVLKLEMKLRDRIQRGADQVEISELKERVKIFKHIQKQFVALELHHEKWVEISQQKIENQEVGALRSKMATLVQDLQAGKYVSFVDVSSYVFDLEETQEDFGGQLNEDFVREVIQRKEMVLQRREENEDDIRESIRDMEELDRIIEGWKSEELSRLQARWNVKLSEFEGWHEMMLRVKQIRQHILQHETIDVRLLAEVGDLRQRSYEIRNTNLGHPLRVAIRELLHTFELIIVTRLENLKFSVEDDVPHAQRVIKGQTGVTVENSRVVAFRLHTEAANTPPIPSAGRLWSRPSPTGNRLNTAVLSFPPVPVDIAAVHHCYQSEVGAELVNLLPQLSERIETTEKALEAKMELFKRLQNFYDAVKYLRSQNQSWSAITVAQIGQVQSELENVVERCDEEWSQDALRLRAELAAIHGSFFQLEFDRLNEKLNLLIYEKDKLRELIAHRRKFLSAATEFITDSKIDITDTATSNDPNSDFRRATDEACAALEYKRQVLQRLGELADMSITDLNAVAALRDFRQRQLGSSAEPPFDSLEKELTDMLKTPLPNTENPQELLVTILRMKEQKKEETKLVGEIVDLPLTEAQRQILEPLQALHEKRNSQREQILEKLVLRHLDWLNKRFMDHEDEVTMLVQLSRGEELRATTSCDGPWTQWKDDVAQLERVVGVHIRSQLHAEFADVHRKRDSLDSKIAKFLSHSEKLEAKLAQFSQWLKLMNEDIEKTRSSVDEPEKSRQLTTLWAIAQKKQRLVEKLERLNVANKEEVLRLCQRYHAIMQILSPYQSTTGIPLHASTHLLTSPFQSQISVSSLASSELERPESVLSLSSSVDVTTTSDPDANPFESKYNIISQKINTIEQSYLNGPKPLQRVLSDVRKLERYHQKCQKILLDLSRQEDEDNTTLESTKHKFMLLTSQYKTFIEKLSSEVKEERELRDKQEEILNKLSTTEENLQNSDIDAIDVAAELDGIQMQMDLLKVICNKPRTYVECELVESSRENSPLDRRHRRKKVLVMVSNTVTTIISVVEQRLLSIAAATSQQRIQEKIDVVKTNLRELDTSSTAKEDALSILSPVSAEEKKDIAEVHRLAGELKQALEASASIASETPQDQESLRAAIDLLKEQHPTLNHLSDVVEAIPIQNENEKVEAVDIFSGLKEEFENTQADLEQQMEDAFHSEWEHVQIPETQEEEETKGETSDGEKISQILKLSTELTAAVEKVPNEANSETQLVENLEFLHSREHLLDSIYSLYDAIPEQNTQEKADAMEIISSAQEKFNNAKIDLQDQLDEQTAVKNIEEDVANEQKLALIHRLAQTVDDAIDESEKINETNENEEAALQKALDLLTSKKDEIQEMFDALDSIPNESENEKLQATEQLSRVQERLLNATSDVQGRLEKLEAEDQWEKVVLPSRPEEVEEKIEIDTDPSQIDNFQVRSDKKIEPALKLEALIEQLQKAVNEAENLVTESSVDSLQAASEKLTKQEAAMREIRDIISRPGDSPALQQQKLQAEKSFAAVERQFQNAQSKLNVQIDELNYGRAPNLNTPDDRDSEDLSPHLLEIQNSITKALEMVALSSDNKKRLLEARAELEKVEPLINTLQGKLPQSSSSTEVIETLESLKNTYLYALSDINSQIDDQEAFEKQLEEQQERTLQLQNVIKQLQEAPISDLDTNELQSIEMKLSKLPSTSAEPLRQQVVALRVAKNTQDRLDQLEVTPLEEVDPQELIDLSHKLDLLTPDQASAVQAKIQSLQEAKQLHEDTKKLCTETFWLLRRMSTKGKKGKKEPTALTVEDVEQKLADANLLVSRIEELASNPQLSSEDKLKVEDFRQRVNSSADDKRNVLASMLDDLQKHAKASETMKRLSEALERTETALETIPQTTVAITDFKGSDAAAFDKASWKSKLDDAVAEQQRLDQLNRSLDELSSILDSVVPKYENPQKAGSG
ncbi:unnamed protein product [Caenorhabditis auriculariae]|uniref:Calponin-homology (CH) domain-containing protein n=1 Tax=Caenorhabditis auriculariae TaxID=2777116 RepID=A0A8S1GMB0_9PELO|nr:unnamed protein product [Caenorhabditis auriculariae]